jgi:trehalose 6-phosphate phosphatase
MKPAPLWGKAWPGWQRRLQRAPAVALFSDFDGTLSPIVTRPRAASLPAATRELLGKLSRQPKVSVALVSGRPVVELRRLVRLPRLAYIGIHGIETAWPGQSVVSRASEADRARIEQARRQLQDALGDIEGLWVEPKPASVAVHYRRAPESSLPRIEKEVRGVLASSRGQLVLQQGKKVLELLPAIGASKAAAVFSMLARLSRWLGVAPLPIYLGDDHTDETVFRRLGGRGLSIYVGHSGRSGQEALPTSAARHFLDDPNEVRKFLRELLALRTAGG